MRDWTALRNTRFFSDEFRLQTLGVTANVGEGGVKAKLCRIGTVSIIGIFEKYFLSA